MVDVSKMHQGSYISIVKFLPSWEVLHLSCISKVTLWKLRGRWRSLKQVWVVLTWWMPNEHQGRYISTFKSLPSWKVFQLLSSPEHHLCVILGVYEDAGGSWEESWWFLNSVDAPRIHQGSCIYIFKSLPTCKVVQFLGGDKQSVTHPWSSALYI